MKRLTMNRVARASLQANKKAYRSMAVGIFLAVFIASAAVFGGWGAVLSGREQVISHVGYADAVFLGSGDISDQDLRDSGLFSAIGNVFVTARIGGTQLFTGYYDGSAYEILPREPLEGRLPQAPGEIALEKSAVAQLQEEISPGDTVTWEMTPIDGIPETRTYTVVGILNDQARYMEAYGSSPEIGRQWPNALVSPDDSPYATGTQSLHRVVRYAPLTLYMSIVDHRGGLFLKSFVAVSRMTGETTWGDPLLYDAFAAVERSAVWWVLGISLLLAVCIGISGAMESVLAGKIEEIGMLRAVGATRRQIRRIFGREAWILALFSLPTGIPAGMAAAWVISLLLPEQIVFRADVRPALAVAALSALCVFLSSRLPLRRASAQAPMGVLRDTGMLRRAKKLRSRKAFRPTALIAGRQMRFHPLRQAGSAAMAALMLLCTVLLAECLLRDPYQEQYDFEIQPINHYWEMRSLCNFAAVERERNILSEQDIAKIRAVPEVKSAVLETNTRVNMVLPGDTVPGYFRDISFESTGLDGVVYKNTFSIASWPVPSLEYLLWDTEERASGIDDYLYTVKETIYREMLGAARVFETEGKLISLPIAVVDPESETLRKAVAQGRIDRRALDAGEEVLVYAPKLFIHMDNEGHYHSTVAELSDRDRSRGYKEVTAIENDYFRPGMTLDLIQAICGADESRIDYNAPQSVEHYEEYYRKTQVQPAHVSIGAVLEGEYFIPLVYDACLVTTEEGLKSLGFEMTEPTIIRVTLRETVDEETEKRLAEQLGNIAARADMEVYDQIAAAREARRSRERTILTWACVLSVFFAVTVAMQVGNTGRRIRADSRMIGTLRAAGADEKALLGCYRLPVIGTVSVGFLLATGLYLAIYILGDIYMHSYPFSVILCMALLGALCLLCCLLGVRLRLRQALRKSVVENIREV